jgi:uncharacterized protein YecE (DUF72 family)
MTGNAPLKPLVGTGGWAYFHVPGRDSLSAYASTFDFVEVNSTYYEYPDLREVSLWRSRVPQKFEFSVRCHKNIVQALRAGQDHLLDDTIGRMGEICNLLEANVLALLVPGKPGIASALLAKKIKHIASIFNDEETRIAVEIRGSASKEVLETMADNNIIHALDISKHQPAPGSQILYSRLFGKGKDNIYQFDDEEIEDIARKATGPKFEKSILAFHGVRMYGDAARLKAFLQTGKFLQVTGQTGLDSLGEVLKEDTKFPASKSEIIARQGWKLFDLTVDKRIRAGEVLSRLPARTYSSHKELMDSLEPLLSNLVR